ncbi:hypothetical protein [Pseudomonas sp. H9]|uniref:hypothetical protein n=1 Tax=Pseudomonas sp. H9 TaxID=483968 RepID=UPI001057F367|nr:hypothetical protein [Pseudomonas sp. H9]TDF85199.1 hypothetical protein E1573_06035 [Pseudomonas sp. H9]
MTPTKRVNRLQGYLWTLELLGEALVNNDSYEGSIPPPQLTVRTKAGVHDAIRIIAGQASQECRDLLTQMDVG